MKLKTVEICLAACLIVTSVTPALAGQPGQPSRLTENNPQALFIKWLQDAKPAQNAEGVRRARAEVDVLVKDRKVEGLKALVERSYRTVQMELGKDRVAFYTWIYGGPYLTRLTKRRFPGSDSVAPYCLMLKPTGYEELRALFINFGRNYSNLSVLGERLLKKVPNDLPVEFVTAKALLAEGNLKERIALLPRITGLTAKYPKSIDCASLSAYAHLLVGSEKSDLRILAKAKALYQKCLAMLPPGDPYREEALRVMGSIDREMKAKGG